MNEVKVKKSEVLKMFLLFNNGNMCKSMLEKLEAFMGNKENFTVSMDVRGGFYGHISYGVTLDRGDTCLELKNGYAWNLYGAGLTLHLGDKDTRISLLLQLVSRLKKENIEERFITNRIVKPYFEGTKTLDIFVDNLKTYQDKYKTLEERLTVQHVRWDCVKSDVKQKYFKGKINAEDVIIAARTYCMQNGGSII